MRPVLPNRRARAMAAIGFAFILVVSACGGGDGDESSDLASIADVENAGAGEGEDASPVLGGDVGDEVDAETAFLEFAECMRAEGLDYPDPTFNADGRIDRGSFAADRSQDGFEEANEICRVELEGAALGGRGGDFQETIQEGLLGFTECLRDQGFVVDDLTFGGGPDGGGDGVPPAGDQGAGGGVDRGQGQRSARLATALGLDAEDPEVATALETCEPVLTEAIGDGPPGAGAE